MYLTFNAPHSPYQAIPEYLEKYKNIKDPTRQTYAAMITAMDDQIGRVVKTLEEKGLRDNTIIVFQSDNGGTRNAMFAGEVDVSKLKIPCDNGPYREGKGSLYEGGTRVPALVNWPGKVPAGASVDEMMHVVDMYPTLVKLVGGSLDKSKPLDGVDVWNTITKGEKSERQEIVYNIEPLRGGIRQGDWKLIWRTPLPYATELYNIKNDPYEKNNLAKEQPEIVVKLQKRIQELATSMEKSMFMAASFKDLQKSTQVAPAFPDEYSEVTKH